MRYAVFTFTGDALPVAHRLQHEGHDVVVGMVEDVADTVPDGETARAEDDLTRARRLSLFDGLLEKKPAWDLVRELTGQTAADTFVLFDRNYLFRFASALANEGLQGNFPTAEDCRLENNREEAKEFVRQHYPSLAVAEVKQFTAIAEDLKR